MRRIAIKTFTLLTACIVGLLLGEGMLRLSGIWVGRHSDTMFTVMDHDSVLGWKMKPNVNGRVSYVDVENIQVHGNSLGFWDREFVLERDPQRHRIVFLGDSFTWGLGVREEERFTNVLETNNSQYESLNFGVPGYGVDQSLLVWKNIASKYRPDVVVMTIYQNDYLDNMMTVRYGRRKPYFEWHEGQAPQLRELDANRGDFWSNGILNEVASPYAALYPRSVERRSRVMHWLVKYSDLGRLLYTTFRSLNESSEATAANAEEGRSSVLITSVADLPRNRQVEIGLMTGLLGDFAAHVRASGAKFIVVLAGHPNPNFDVQKLELDRLGVSYIDATTDSLAIKLPAGKQQVYFSYNNHWTPEAHRAVAGLLAEALK